MGSIHRRKTQFTYSFGISSSRVFHSKVGGAGRSWSKSASISQHFSEKTSQKEVWDRFTSTRCRFTGLISFGTNPRGPVDHGKPKSASTARSRHPPQQHFSRKVRLTGREIRCTYRFGWGRSGSKCVQDETGGFGGVLARLIEMFSRSTARSSGFFEEGRKAGFGYRCSILCVYVCMYVCMFVFK